ncbi:MAG: LPS export ABC transporter periplasmic protein LptC [Syntrophaceae bacterium]|nr:LPS export ABC transporter periplasmic protein LptC [Syntrophaceae bacterium]
MRKSLRIKLAVVLVIILAVAGFYIYFGAQQTEEKAPAPLKIVPEKADLQAQDILFTEVGGSDVKYEIRAKTLQYQRKDNIAEFETVNVKLVLTSGKIYRITSDRGTYNTEKKDITMMGNVVVKSDEGDRIMTDKLYYTDAERKIHTSSPVTIVNKDIEVTGVGLTLLLDKKQLTLRSRVKAKIAANRKPVKQAK